MDTPIILPVKPQVIGVDSLWFDPRLLSIVTYPYYRDVQLVGNKNEPVASSNISRYAIGFTLGPGAFTVNFAPWPDAQKFAFSNTTGVIISLWFELKKFGPIVSSSWYAFSTAPTPVRVTEMLRKE